MAPRHRLRRPVHSSFCRDDGSAAGVLKFMKPTAIHLKSIEGHLKGNWYEWQCTAEMPDGTEVDGYAQADGQGEGVAVETFEKAE